MEPDIELTILLPYPNQAGTVAACIRKAKSFLKANALAGEIVVADNSNTDGSARIDAVLGARVVGIAERGSGAALLGGLRAFRAPAVPELGLRSAGMQFASEMMVRSSPAGLTIVEVPVTLQPGGHGQPPHLNTRRDGWRHLRPSRDQQAYSRRRTGHGRSLPCHDRRSGARRRVAFHPRSRCVRLRPQRLGHAGLRPAPGPHDPMRGAGRYDDDRHWNADAVCRVRAGDFDVPMRHLGPLSGTAEAGGDLCTAARHP